MPCRFAGCIGVREPQAVVTPGRRQATLTLPIGSGALTAEACRPARLDTSSCIYKHCCRMTRRERADALHDLVARECIATKVRLLNRAVTAIYDEALRPFGLKVTQMTVLVTVAGMESASPGAVGRIPPGEIDPEPERGPDAGTGLAGRRADRGRPRPPASRDRPWQTAPGRSSSRVDQGAGAHRRDAEANRGYRGISRTVALFSRTRSGGA